MPVANNERKRHREYIDRVLIYVACLIAAAGWGFMTSRASDDDLEKLEKQHKEDVETVQKSLKTLETNSVRVCQFLDRKDREEGGPGVECKDPE